MLYLKDYASYISDEMVSEFADINQNMMISIDIIPIPTDEAVNEAQNRLLGVETNITNWQRRQNANQNFSATVPYDMELQKEESREFLRDLTTRDQRMMVAVVTFMHTAESKKTVGRRYPYHSVSCEKPDVPDGSAEIPADGRDEYRTPDWCEED